MANVCIVGCGAIGPIHASAVEKAASATLCGVCDNDKERADALAKKHKVKAFYDFGEVLADKNIDSVHICTPHYLHKDMAIAAMQASKNVVLEKPAAMNNAEFSELLATREQTGSKVCLVFQNRTNGGVEKLKEIAESGEYGELLGIEGSLLWHRDEAYYKHDDWRGKWATEGGGLMINQAVHLVDLFSFLGGGIKSVRASISTKYLNGVIEAEDTCDVLFGMQNGIRGCFYATNAYNSNKPMRIELQFEKALFRYADSRLYKITDDACEVIASDNTDTLGKRYWGTGHQRVIGEFYYALENGGDYISLEDGINSSRALFAVYESAKMNGKEIIL
ncbi:MAG: Gfo/Idh/MocA family oxidoreductase [Clostridia bacterium]|nr:Gfo/Idh/MocA family oxidoreductase [Clostridia bacterium]